MTNFNITIIILLSIFHSFEIKAQTNSDNIIGIWQTEDNRAAIQMYKKGNLYYGKIVWEKEPYNKNGKLTLDINNPNPNLQSRPLHNLTIVKNLKFYKNSNQYKGTIYNVESGNTFKINAELINKTILKIRGYIGISLIGRTTVWKRIRKIKDNHIFF